MAWDDLLWLDVYYVPSLVREMPEHLHSIFEFGHIRGVGVEPLKLFEDFSHHLA